MSRSATGNLNKQMLKCSTIRPSTNCMHVRLVYTLKVALRANDILRLSTWLYAHPVCLSNGLCLT